MDKRTFLAFILSSAVLVLWYFFFLPAPVPKKPAPEKVAVSSPGRTASTPLPKIKSLLPAKEILLETPSVRIHAESSNGGLTHYFIKEKADSAFWPDLVLSIAQSLLSTPGVRFAKYERLDESRMSFWGELPATEGPGNSRIEIIKTLDFKQPQEFLYEISISLYNPSRLETTLRREEPLGFYISGLGTDVSGEKQNAGLLRSIGLVSGERIKKLSPGSYPAGGFGWAGVDNQYFLAAFISASKEAQFVVRREASPQVALTFPSEIRLQPKERKTLSALLYLGPKRYTALKGLRVAGKPAHLEASVDFGWFTWIGKACLHTLHFFYRWTKNYGVAIILLTFLMQALIFPLSKKSYASMAKMKEIAPLMEAIRIKYKDDAKRMNTEMMELYRSKGVNPMGGCLPLLLQMPIFVALYNTLRGVYELRGAPFVLWIRDLSVKDPYYVLPILMGAIMFLQQKLSPPAGDPQQAKIFQFMPLIFTFMFLSFPSGLVLYWLVSSLLSFGVQKLFFAKSGGAK